MALNKVFLVAGIVLLVGIVIIAISDLLLADANDNLWDQWWLGSDEDYMNAGKQVDKYALLWEAGFVTILVGAAIMAFGLATMEPRGIQYRQVETVIPPMQYPPPSPPPPKV